VGSVKGMALQSSKNRLINRPYTAESNKIRMVRANSMVNKTKQ